MVEQLQTAQRKVLVLWGCAYSSCYIDCLDGAEEDGIRMSLWAWKMNSAVSLCCWRPFHLFCIAMGFATVSYCFILDQIYVKKYCSCSQPLCQGLTELGMFSFLLMNGILD